MRKSIYFILSLLLISLYSCVNQDPNWFNLEELEELKDKGVSNPLNDDNIIFLPSHTYKYSYKYIRSGQELKFKVFFNKKCIEDHTISCIDYAIDSLSSKYTIDYINLLVFKNTADNDLSNTQTIIKYDYFNNSGGSILYGEQTGVVEDSTQIFLHPPRSFNFSITEFAPFPYLKLPLEIGKRWNGELHIPSYWITKAKLDIEMPTNSTTIMISHEYSVMGKERIETPLGPLDCFIIKAEGLSDFGTSTLMMYFNETHGFIKLDYLFFTGEELKLSLVEKSDVGL